MTNAQVWVGLEGVVCVLDPGYLEGNLKSFP